MGVGRTQSLDKCLGNAGSGHIMADFLKDVTDSILRDVLKAFITNQMQNLA